MLRWHLAISLGVLSSGWLMAGCGLFLDVDPPDPLLEADASVDAAVDGGVDGGVDAATDAGADAGGAVCGNLVVEAGEDCDDGNDFDGDGCRGDCTFECEDDADCDASDLCQTVGCDPALHTCVVTGGVVCPERPTCDRLVGCDPALGCVYEPLEELCDGVDQDCDGAVDEGAGLLCGADVDEDGFGTPDGAVVSCESTCPDGASADVRDCWDGPRSAPFGPPGPQLANPAQMTWFLEPRGDGSGSFDWNCDGLEEPRWPDLYDGTCDAARGACRPQSGWTVGFVPPCGETRHAFIACNNGFGGTCVPVMSNERQPCR